MAKKREITGAIQNSPFCSPLYLPQIYWLILRNGKNATEVNTETDVRRSWEAEYLALCTAFGIRHKDAQKEPFWSPGVVKLLPSIETTAAVEEAIDKHEGLGKLFYITGRKDQRIKMPCEAIGLIAYDETRLKDDQPTPFFFSLLKDAGCIAAIRVLARILSIPYPTVDYLKVTPSQLLELGSAGETDSNAYMKPVPADFQNKSAGTYSLAAFTNALHSWFQDNKPSDSNAIPKGIVEIVRKFPPVENDDWRMSNPDEQLVSALAKLGLALVAASKDISKEMKETIMAKLSKLTGATSNMRPHNLILVGPPGTGKTRIAKTLARELLAGREITAPLIREFSKKQVVTLVSNPNVLNVQFHPSYGYEDFVEGLRPVPNLDKSSTVRYAVVPGPFKAATQLARAYNDKNYQIPLTIYADPQSRRLVVPKEYDLFRLLQRDGVFKLKSEKSAESFSVKPSDQEPNVPAGWPTGYQDVLWSPTEADASKQFVVLIDELNRGNPASIFGELLSLIEGSKRIGQSEEMELILPVSKEPFRLPSNLHIVATMNLADRSLAMLDQAFRRRFKFIYMKPDFSLIRDPKTFKEITEVEKPDQQLNEMVANHFEVINHALMDCQVSQECLIGHSYAFQLLSLIYKDGLTIEEATKVVWDNELHSLIREVVGENIAEFGQKFEEHAKGLTGVICASIREYLQDASVPEVEWKKAA